MIRVLMSPAHTPSPPVAATESRRGLRWLLHVLPWLFALLVGGLLFAAVRSLLGEVSYAQVAAAMRATPRADIALALLATAASYVALMGYDYTGLRYAGAQVSRQVLGMASFCAYALGNTIGLGVLTGGAVRYRIYSAAGVEAAAVARAIGFITAGFGAGITIVGAVALIWAAPIVAGVMPMAAIPMRVLALLVLVLAAAFIALCLRRREVQLFGRWPLRLPSAGLASQQILISAIDILFAGLALWVLLPDAPIGFGGFLAFYAIGIALGVISHVPGGLGVFEAVILLAYGGQAPVEDVAGALVLYRMIYYVVPLLLAMALLGLHELRSALGGSLGRAAARTSPLLLAAMTLIVGLMLLISGVIPASDEATALLSLAVPLPLVESAHFLGSVTGLALLFAARGLLRRLDAAWWMTLLLACCSFVLAIPKGLALTEMLVLGVLILTLVAARKEFTRRASVFAQAFTGGWLVMLALSVAAMTWLLFFVYRDVPYADDLWWQFAFDAHAPRSLRATLAVTLLALVLVFWQWLRPASGDIHPPTDDELKRARAIVQAQPRADAGLALMADKNFLFSESGRAFIMYGKNGRTWVSLYDPVGPIEDWPELIWDFVELAAEHGGRAAFYQVQPDQLSLYLDAGLQALKLGEYASVRLDGFSLKGPLRAPMRQAISKGEREGLSLEVIDADAVAAVLPTLKTISDQWLDHHRAQEKSFSLGAFDEDYLCQFPVALIRFSGEIVAFASLLHSATGREASVDLMRYGSTAPRGTMDYLFVKMILHYQTLGYQRFGLGMAPLSGLKQHPLSSRWHRFGNLLFRHGEQFYNFRGLRAFKEKFEPVWEPRYLCTPGGLHPFIALADIAALSSGGLRGVIGK